MSLSAFLMTLRIETRKRFSVKLFLFNSCKNGNKLSIFLQVHWVCGYKVFMFIIRSWCIETKLADFTIPSLSVCAQVTHHSTDFNQTCNLDRFQAHKLRDLLITI